MKTTQDERRDLTALPVYLNGKAAAICGARNDFATVRTFDGTLQANYSWSAVRRIVSQGGKFRA